MVRKVFSALLILVVIYLGTGLAFHLKWKSALKACSEMRRAQGEFVEPEMSPVLGIFFDVTWWPVYAWANIYQDGTPFATPCTHSRHSRHIGAAECEQRSNFDRRHSRGRVAISRRRTGQRVS